MAKYESLKKRSRAAIKPTLARAEALVNALPERLYRACYWHVLKASLQNEEAALSDIFNLCEGLKQALSNLSNIGDKTRVPVISPIIGPGNIIDLSSRGIVIPGDLTKLSAGVDGRLGELRTQRRPLRRGRTKNLEGFDDLAFPLYAAIEAAKGNRVLLDRIGKIIKKRGVLHETLREVLYEFKFSYDRFGFPSVAFNRDDGGRWERISKKSLKETSDKYFCATTGGLRKIDQEKHFRRATERGGYTEQERYDQRAKERIGERKKTAP